MCKLLMLVGFAIAFSLALPSGSEAASLTEVRKLIASDAEARDFLGRSVAIEGDVAVVRGDRATYIFLRDEGGAANWGEATLLTDPTSYPVKNSSVAVSGDTVIVGANEDNAEGREAGAAYIFQRDAGGTDNWGEVIKLTASDAEAGDRFGGSVAISSDIAVVGAAYEDGDAWAPEDIAPRLPEQVDTGAAYVFLRDAGGTNNWGEVTKLTASDALPKDHFGWSVAVSGDTAVVGAPFGETDSQASGPVYVFQRDAGGTDNWGQVNKLTASDSQRDFFGGSVAVSGDTIVVGAHVHDYYVGAAYIFQRDAGGTGNWGEVKKLRASDGQAAVGSNDQFGHSVAVSGDTAVVAARGADILVSGPGAAYVFKRDQGGQDNWGDVSKLTASDATERGGFGSSVAVSGDTAVVGSCCQGTELTGAAYIFDLLVSKPKGDANCDGSVNAVDAALVLQFNAGLLGSLSCPDAGDADGDGEITSLDAALILQFTLGLLDSLPP